MTLMMMMTLCNDFDDDNFAMTLMIPMNPTEEPFAMLSGKKGLSPRHFPPIYFKGRFLQDITVLWILEKPLVIHHKPE